MANEKQLDFFKKKYYDLKKEGHPAHKHLEKVIHGLENNGSPTEVLKNAIHAHCYECSHDSADAAASHPKKCNSKDCPLHSHRPGATKEKKDVDPEIKVKRQANAEKARAGRKLKITEIIEKL